MIEVIMLILVLPVSLVFGTLAALVALLVDSKLNPQHELESLSVAYLVGGAVCLLTYLGLFWAVSG